MAWAALLRRGRAGYNLQRPTKAWCRVMVVEWRAGKKQKHGRYSRPLQVIHLDICFLCHYTIGVSFIKGRLCRQGTLVNGRVLHMPKAIRPSQLEFDRLKHSKPKCTCTSKDLDSRSPFSTADSERSSLWTLSSQKFLEKMSPITDWLYCFYKHLLAVNMIVVLLCCVGRDFPQFGCHVWPFELE